MLNTILQKLEACWFIALLLLFVTGAFRVLHQRGHGLVSGAPDMLVEVIGAMSFLAFTVLLIALLSPLVRATYARFSRGNAD